MAHRITKQKNHSSSSLSKPRNEKYTHKASQAKKPSASYRAGDWLTLARASHDQHRTRKRRKDRASLRPVLAKRPRNNEENRPKNDQAKDAAAHYSSIKRSLKARPDSRLYHMRAFHGWVKAMQILEVDPIIVGKGRRQPQSVLRVLDLACGKGGDLGKWTFHPLGIKKYVGIDIASQSLQDAAVHARELRKKHRMNNVMFVLADLGKDELGSSSVLLPSWSLQHEKQHESRKPYFRMTHGGGILPTDRFDVVSIQFAIHHIMSSRSRARRFFHTISQLLEMGGNLICTTVDARIVGEKVADLGLDLHDDNNYIKLPEVVVGAGSGACELRFAPNTIKRFLSPDPKSSKDPNSNLFGLEYKFSLIEGSKHAARVGCAENLPEWLVPIPLLQSLACEAGLELLYAHNFHDFYHNRKDPAKFPVAHRALQTMKVLNRHGSISSEEWDVSRLYIALKFRKVRKSAIQLAEESSGIVNTKEQFPTSNVDKNEMKEKLRSTVTRVKRKLGAKQWASMPNDEKKRIILFELQKIGAA